MFAVIDRASRNVMGEFDSFQEAEALLIDLVGAHPPAAAEVEIVSDRGEPVDVRTDVLRDAAWRSTALTG